MGRTEQPSNKKKAPISVKLDCIEDMNSCFLKIIFSGVIKMNKIKGKIRRIQNQCRVKNLLKT